MLEQGGLFAQAEKAYRRADRPLDAARCLDESGAHFQAGRRALNSGDGEAALRYLGHVDPGSDDHDKAALLRGQILEKKGQALEAAHAYNTYLAGKKLDARNKKLFAHTIRLYEKLGEGRRAWATPGRSPLGAVTGGPAVPPISLQAPALGTGASLWSSSSATPMFAKSLNRLSCIVSRQYR